jgi:hypothetical protein
VQNLEASSQTAPGTRFFNFYPPEKGESSDSPVLDDPETGRYFTLWSDRGFEGSTHPIVVWKKRNDSLEFEAVLNRALVVGIGSADLKEIVHLGERRHLLIGDTGGGDGGDTWGSVWVGLWTEPRDLRIIYEPSYQGDLNGDQKVEYHYDRQTRSIKFRKYARTFRDGQAMDDPKEWKLKKAGRSLSPRCSDERRTAIQQIDQKPDPGVGADFVK